MANGPDNVIMLPSTHLWSFVARPFILQRSSRPCLAANLTLHAVSGGGELGLGVDGGNIAIDTTPAEVDPSRGVEVVGYGNGTYASGDLVYVRCW